MGPLKQYRYHNNKSRPWHDIEEFYNDLWKGKHIGLLEMVRYIQNSGLSKRLYGTTSMDKLIVSIDDPMDFEKECLHIRFDLDKRLWNFEYCSKPFEKTRFKRTYSEDQGLQKFVQFVKNIGW